MFDFQKAFEELDKDKDHIKVYISGPITNDKDHFEETFQKAEKFIENLSIEGLHPYKAVNPLDYEVEYRKEDKWTKETWLKCIIKDLELLSHCDMIALLPGWEVSAGCIEELIAAKKLGLYIAYFHNSPKNDFNLFDFPIEGYAEDMESKVNNIKNITIMHIEEIPKIFERLLKTNPFTKEEEFKWAIKVTDANDTNSWYVSNFQGNKSYDLNENFENALKFKNYKEVLKTYYLLIDIQKNNSNFLYDKHIEIKKINSSKNYKIMYFEEGKEKYVNSINSNNLIEVSDKRQSQNFTKEKAVKILESILYLKLKDKEGNLIEPVIIKEEK